VEHLEIIIIIYWEKKTNRESRYNKIDGVKTRETIKCGKYILTPFVKTI